MSEYGTVNLGGFYTEDDPGFGMLVSLDIGAPERQDYSIQVPGRNGTLDLTEDLFGSPRYYNRIVTATYSTVSLEESQNLWWTALDSAMALHGQTVYAYTSDDPDWYFEGVVSVSSDASEGTITLELDCQPYRLSAEENGSEVPSDATGIYLEAEVSGDGDATLTVGDAELELSEGTYELGVFPATSYDTDVDDDTTITVTSRWAKL